MNPIKVMHVIPTLGSGGAERQLANLVCNTSPEIIEHIVCMIEDNDFFGSSIRSAGYRTVNMRINKKRPFIRASMSVRKVIKESKPDILHSWLYNGNVVTRLASLGFNSIPIVASLQLPDYDPVAAKIGNWNPIKVGVLKKIDKLTAHFKKPHFVACSNFVRESYIRYFGITEAGSSVIYNAFDPTGLETEAGKVELLKKELNLPPESFVFFNVGRFDPQKNHRNLIPAFRRVLDEAADAYLLLAGVGILREEIEDLAAECGVSDRVLFLGRRDDIGDLLELADVFVFPSFFEGLGIALVEAMSKGVPCIASDIGVFREVLQDENHGLFIDPHSQPDLTAAMLRLYNDADLRTRLGKASRLLAESRYSIKVTVASWEELYKKLVGR